MASHLDPRQAGTGAAPDVETINKGTIGWTAFPYLPMVLTRTHC